MENSGCAVAMKEAKFETDELFFSITDHASTILSGNDVFVRISGYTKEELIGRFHNIIRHPDMPKIVFKTLWDHLQNNRPLVAYVKNRTKEGGFYWVLAAVFPLDDRYVSIRIKPGTPIFTAVRELYFKLLMAESKGGMDASGPMLESLLRELGYRDYDHFMSDALLCELTERKKTLQNNVAHHPLERNFDSELGAHLQSLHEDCSALMQSYDSWFDKIDLFSRVKSMFEEKGVLLRHLARDIVFLSLNASVASYKAKSGGETFGVLASDIRINAKENDILIGHIHATSQSLAQTLNDLIFAVSAIRLQMEAIIYFIEETMSEKDETDIREASGNMKTLIELATLYGDKVSVLQDQMDKLIRENLNSLDRLEQQVMYLGYVQVYGIIEAAGSQDQSMGFGGIFSQLKVLIENTSKEVFDLQKIGRNFQGQNRMLIDESRKTEVWVKHLNDEMRAVRA